jgi:hypothetical protein
MFPIGDDDTQRRTVPVVTFALIGINLLVFLIELSGGATNSSRSGRSSQRGFRAKPGC